MNIQQAKALFFAQYLGQRIEYELIIGDAPILRTEPIDGIDLYGTCNVSEIYEIDFDENMPILLLRGIDQLTDEEINRVTTLVFGNNTNIEKILARDGVENMFVNGWNIRGDKMIVIFDYLRCIGVLLPFTYLSNENKPITLSASEILELGWAKIKSV